MGNNGNEEKIILEVEACEVREPYVEELFDR